MVLSSHNIPVKGQTLSFFTSVYGIINDQFVNLEKGFLLFSLCGFQHQE